MAAKVEKKSKKKSSKKLMLLEKKKAMEEAARVAAEAAKVAAKEAAAAARAVEKELNDDTSSNSSEVVDKNPSISSKIEKVSNSFVKEKKYKESKKRDKNSLMKKVNVTCDEKENDVVNSSSDGSSDSSSDSNSDDSKNSNSNSDGSSDSSSDDSKNSNSNSDDSKNSNSNSDGSSDSNSNSNSDGSSDSNSNSDGSSDSNSDSSSDDSSDSNNANSSAVYHEETESKNIKMRNTAPESLVEKQRKVSNSSSSSDSANSSGISDGEKEYKDIKVQNAVSENIVEKQRKISDDSNRNNANLDNYQQKNEGISKKRQINLDTEENAQIKKKVAIENDETNLKIYVRGLPWKATEDEVREYFSTCGEIISIEMPIMDDGRSSGTAIINFKTKQACETCLELNGSDFNGRWLNIKYSTPKPIWSPREPSQKVDGCTTVFVGNLSFQIDEDTLREAFGECGEITQVRFAEDRETGQFKGFGHIEFAKTESTNLAVKMTGTNIMGRPVRVDFANPRKNTFGGGRGRGHDGGRGRGHDGGRGRGHDGGRGRSAMRGGGRGRSAMKKSGIMQFSGSKTTFD